VVEKIADKINTLNKGGRKSVDVPISEKITK